MIRHDGPLRLGAFLTTRRDGQRDKAVFDDALDIATHAERLGYKLATTPTPPFAVGGPTPRWS